MNILIVCQYFYPEQFLINDIASELVKRGHKVTVLTGRPNYPDGVVKKGYPSLDEYKGVRVIRCYEIGRKKGMILNYFSFLKSANKRAKKLEEEFDVVFVYQLSPITMAEPAIKYKQNHPNTKLFLYCLDIWPESVKAHIPIKPIFNKVAKYSKKIYQSFDRIAVTSRPFIDYLSRVDGVGKNKMVYIPQHAVGDLINKDLTCNNNIKHFLFAGNLGKGQRLDVIIKALSLVDLPYIMNFVGSGSQEIELKKLANTLGLSDKIVFHSKKTYEQMEEFYRNADALLITLRGNNEVGNTLPGKFQTYMSVGKPIFGAINGAANEIIKESGCGACVGAEDYEGLSKILIDYLDDPKKYDTCGINARSYYRAHFTFDIFMESLEKELEGLC